MLGLECMAGFPEACHCPEAGSNRTERQVFPRSATSNRLTAISKEGRHEDCPENVGQSSYPFGGLSALGAGLYSIGIPKDSIVKYEKAIKSGSFLLLAHGTAADVSRAKEIVSSTQSVEFAEHLV